MTEQMKGAKWTPEPWVVRRNTDLDSKDYHHQVLGDGWGLFNCYAIPRAGGAGEAQHNAHRIVQCVNAMQGIANPEAVAGLVEAAWEYLEHTRTGNFRNAIGERLALSGQWENLRKALAALKQEKESRG